MGSFNGNKCASLNAEKRDWQITEEGLADSMRETGRFHERHWQIPMRETGRFHETN